MERARTFRRTALLVAAFFLIFFLALRSFFAEYRAVLSISGTTNDVIAALEDRGGILPQPSSSRTIRDILAVCGRLLTLSPRLRADPALAESVSTQCGRIAEGFVGRSPMNARALAVVLLTSKRIEAERFAAAQSAAPYEPWPLNIRLQAVVRAGTLSPDVAVLAADDLGRAMQSRWGKEELARLYISHEWFRPLITRAADAATSADQREFLDLLRREMRGGA